ncbi:MAG: hypothetical protein IPP70_00020 [Elusimicrobia bacterium]|nr:hypothetical protein [Elusimicrobiota bacterium]
MGEALGSALDHFERNRANVVRQSPGACGCRRWSFSAYFDGLTYRLTDEETAAEERFRTLLRASTLRWRVTPRWEDLEEKARNGGRFSTEEGLFPLPRTRLFWNWPRWPTDPWNKKPGPRSQFHRRHQPQLHEHLRHRLPLLRLLPAAQGP